MDDQLRDKRRTTANGQRETGKGPLFTGLSKSVQSVQHTHARYRKDITIIGIRKVSSKNYL